MFYIKEHWKSLSVCGIADEFGCLSPIFHPSQTTAVKQNLHISFITSFTNKKSNSLSSSLFT